MFSIDTKGFLYNFCQVNSLDHLLFPRISWIFDPDKLATEVGTEHVEWPLNKDTSIPDKDVTSFIHLDTVETEAILWDLFMPDNSCVFFSSLHSCDVFRYTFKVWITQRSVSFLFFIRILFQVLEVLYPFPKCLAILQNWTQLFLQKGTWSVYQGDGYLRL